MLWTLLLVGMYWWKLSSWLSKTVVLVVCHTDSDVVCLHCAPTAAVQRSTTTAATRLPCDLRDWQLTISTWSQTHAVRQCRLRAATSVSCVCYQSNNQDIFNPLTPIVATWLQATAIQYPVPERVKPPSFVIFDIRALWRSDLSVRVPGCHKLQMIRKEQLIYFIKL